MKNIFSLMIIILVTAMFATTINVPEDYETIQEAITESQSGDIVLIAQGTYNENIDFEGKQITVTSNYITSEDQEDIENTIIHGVGYLPKVVYFGTGESNQSILNGLTISGGNGGDYLGSGGGIVCESSVSPSLTNLIITGNIGSYGGGVIVLDNSQPIIDNCIFENNGDGYQYSYGAALYVKNSTATVTNSTFRDNNCGQGAGIFLYILAMVKMG